MSDLLEFHTLRPEASLDDLEPLRALVGDARVVALGESAHHVREFYLLRHRLLRFLVERCGFTVYALEAPFANAQPVDAWVRGGPGPIPDLSARDIDDANPAELRDTLAWLREHNATAGRPVRFAGCLGGAPAAALTSALGYLSTADPDAVPLARRALELAGGDPERPSMLAVFDYPARDPAVQNELTSTLGRLLTRMQTMAGFQRTQGRARAHAEALHHVSNACALDHTYRDVSGRGMAVGTACMEAAGARTVRRLLREGGPDARVVVAVHNTHIRKTPVVHEGDSGLFPLGYHLAQAFGEDYVAIAATHGTGRTISGHLDPEHPRGFHAEETAVPAPGGDCVETLFADSTVPMAVADVRSLPDRAAYRRIRMLDSFMDVPIAAAYDAVVSVPETRGVRWGTSEAHAPT